MFLVGGACALIESVNLGVAWEGAHPLSPYPFLRAVMLIVGLWEVVVSELGQTGTSSGLGVLSLAMMSPGKGSGHGCVSAPPGIPSVSLG